MGLSFSFLKDWWLGQQDFRILMTGLDNAGKTTMLYKLSLGEVIHTIPTIGFNVETVNYRNVSFNVWDLGGQKKIRVLWHYYYFNCQAIIFVVDSTDYFRFNEVKEELQAMLKEESLKEAKLLVLNNKSDLPMSKSSSIVASELGICSITNREWAIQSCCAKSGEGVIQGLEKLYLSLTGRRKMLGEIC